MNEEQDVKNKSGDTASVTEEGQVSVETQDVDLKAENEDLKQRLKKAEDTIVESKRKSKLSTEDESEVDKRLKALEESNNKSRENLIAAEIAKVSVNEEHAKKIREIYDSRINKTDDIQSDIENASLLTDNLVFKSENVELKKAIRSSQTRSQYSGSGTRQNHSVDYESQLTPKERRFAEKMGLSAEEVVKSREN